jgi:glutamate-1-semialdehyde 2,1-aminomutase
VTRVLRDLTRHFAQQGIGLPSGAAACLSTPMVESEIQLIVDVFADFLSSRAALIEELQ